MAKPYTNGEKTFVGGLIAIIVVLLLVFLLRGCDGIGLFGGGGSSDSDIESRLAALELSDSLQNARLEICCPEEEEKKPAPKKNNRRGAGIIDPVGDKNKAENVEEKGVDDFNPTTDFSASNRDNTSLSPGKYIALEDGDLYITISDDGKHPKYVVARKLLNPAWGKDYQLNFAGSKKYFQVEGENLVYVDKSTPISEGFLTTKHTWGVYCGNDLGWPTYLQHELVKTAIMSVRSRLDGKITPEEVREIGTHVQAVGQGKVRPNNITGEGGDGKSYEGWEIVTGVTYEVKSSR